MAAEFFDYDPFTGLTEYYEEADGKIRIHTVQEVAPFLDLAKKVANSGSSDDAWRKDGAALYAWIPPIVVGQMLKKGINVFDQNHISRVVREVNENYPNLKTTYKHHSVKER